jgi:transcriptional regulator with XRE-family HTH domain/predicted nucleotidyltransferase/energy-coupling factor transporter ATP-binding protein EcfA2
MIAILDGKRLSAVMETIGETQASIARKSGVSRAQLGRLVSGNEARVRQGTLERLARALDISPDALLVGGAIPRYKRWLAEQAGYIDFRGFGMPTVQRQPIQEVFVDLAVEEEVGECQGECSPRESRLQNLKRRPEGRVPATSCVRNQDRVVILGNPGSGKTTLLRFLAVSSATTEGESTETPIYVRLPEFCRAQELDEGVDLVKFLAARAAERGCPDMEEPLRRELTGEKRPCLVLLDGLDEVGNQEQMDRLIRTVQTFVEEYPRNRYAVASRLVGFDAAPWRSQGFSVFRLLEYDRASLERFAEKWSEVLSRTENKPLKEVRERLNRAIFSSPRVRALASSPLILTILVLLNEARGGVLPRRRVDLYEKVVDVFLETWESNKRSVDSFEGTRGIDLDAREFRWLLSDLSLAMQKAERTLAPRWWIAEKIEGYLQHKLGFAPDEAKDVCDRLIRYLAERTGLVEERGLGLFGFSHRTLQEYFASLGVIDEADASPARGVTGCLRGYYFHPQWPEVVRLVAAQLAPPLAESLLASILDDPDPVGRFLRRGPLLVLKCLLDGTSIANRRFVNGVLDSLVEAGKSHWLGIALKVIDVLQHFEGTRLQDSACRTLEAILETAKRELDVEEYQCLYQWVHACEFSGRAVGNLHERLLSVEAAAGMVDVSLGDAACQVFYVNDALWAENPDKWHASARSLLEDPNQAPQLKQVLLQEMGRRVATDGACRLVLRKILCSAADAPLRVACAEALATVTRGKNNAKRLLLRVLQKDPNDEVRQACAAALRYVAQRDSAIADRLVEVLTSGAPSSVRAGAARGLAKGAASWPAVREQLERRLGCADEQDDVRIACARALKSQMGTDLILVQALKSWLKSPAVPRLQRVAGVLLATAMAEETLDWDHEVIEKVETLLMGLEAPSPAALGSLEAIAMARELRHGLRLENVLRDSLRPVADSIELAFVFGSTARNRQTQESDIDLLIIGEATLKSLSGPLRQAENMLGRRISPVVYTREAFGQRYQRGDPFLLDVYRREKIPVIRRSGEISQKEFEDELRGMVSEQLDSTA